jgi:hypothetical protein
MVFIIKTIESHDRSNLVLQNDDKILMSVNHHSMSTILSQLSDLVEYSGFVFEHLLADSTKTFQRINTLSKRLGDIAHTTKEVEGYMNTTTLDTMLSTARSAFTSEPGEQDQLFTKASLPEGVKQMYDQAMPPPNFSILDPYMEGGVPSLKLYTNPNFFIEEWISEQLKIREEALKEKKKRRAERKKQREAKKAQMKAREEQEVKVTQIQVAKYDPVTGEKILVPTQVRSGASSTQATFKGMSSQTPLGDWGDDMPPPPPDDEFPMDDNIPLPPPPEDFPLPPPDIPGPPPPEQPQAKVFQIPAPTPGTRPNVLTPDNRSTSMSNPETPPRPSPIAPQVNITPAPVAPLPPPVAPLPGNRTPSVSGPDKSSSFSPPSPINAPDAPPPPVINIPDAPIPPPVAGMLPPMGGTGNLQSALANRGALHAVTPQEKPKHVDARSSLLESIKQKNINLKSAKDRQLADKKGDDGGAAQSVASILSRRIAIIGESSSDEEKSDEEGWD